MLDFSHTKIDFRRSIFSYDKVLAAIDVLVGPAIRKRAVRNSAALANETKRGGYLDIGCGANALPDFCNLDYRWAPGVDICWDVTHGLPFPNEFFAGVFTEHMLEHLAFADALALLAETRRVLRAGGTLRVVVPDGELYLSEYAKHLAGGASSMPYAEYDAANFPFVTPIISVNRIFREHGHQFIWDHETLRLALLGAGFAKVEKRAFGEGADPKLLCDSPSRRLESLYVEAS
ncbi:MULTISPECIES: class I SAM-dependent methyltransferase [Methylosinus]|uniref:Methyltransferase domain-containing protein n=1 Tax=Methylosinus trichosporium (strain ATCC 35070 / NCIMB 11131 / UNIQEM 75 / OB3b) TaxID=595536 RepID=A0A2D2D449_METT3|nr:MULTISPECIES: methyltransferase domain-containing protein [Methylosinus]ATQ69762.1 methyltransferase domain-containing protein [Methylosinus trichosporium OB3b]OBS52438.1 hypothetical protein A8B73_11315 [Methylosinus sp. 3S-1]